MDSSRHTGRYLNNCQVNQSAPQLPSTRIVRPIARETTGKRHRRTTALRFALNRHGSSIRPQSSKLSHLWYNFLRLFHRPACVGIEVICSLFTKSNQHVYDPCSTHARLKMLRRQQKRSARTISHVASLPPNFIYASVIEYGVIWLVRTYKLPVRDHHCHQNVQERKYGYQRKCDDLERLCPSIFGEYRRKRGLCWLNFCAFCGAVHFCGTAHLGTIAEDLLLCV